MKAAVFDEESKGQKYELDRDPRRPQGDRHASGATSSSSPAPTSTTRSWRSTSTVKPEKVTDAMIHRALRFGTINFKLVPVICGSAFKNKGVQMLLDAVVNYLPSPIDIPPVKGIDPSKKDKPEIERKASDDEPFSALAFKILNDPHGNLTFFRVYSGKVASGTMVLNSSRDKRERIGRILRMHANKREEVQEADAGNIFAAVGFRDTRTGDTLCDEKHPDPARADDLPRARHLDRDRAEDEGRRREARRGLAEARPGRPELPRAHRRGERARRSSAGWASSTSRSSSTA